MKIWHLTDGKAGHIAQVRGLFAALKRLQLDFEVIEQSVEHLTWSDYTDMFFSPAKIRSLLFSNTTIDDSRNCEPDLIIGCGHTTHIPLILFKRAFKKTRTLLLMSPSIPLFFFDLVMMPDHDRRSANKRTFVYEGVINALQNLGEHQSAKHMILIGGPSKRHQWSSEVLNHELSQLLDYTKNNTSKSIAFTLSTSRRTPESVWKISVLQNSPIALNSVSDRNATMEWMYRELHQSDVAWVTEDSMSMIYEALNAGCKVGLLSLPRHREDRITAAVDELVASGTVLTLEQYLGGKPFPVALQSTEADRAALWLCQQLRIPTTQQKKPEDNS